MRETFQGSSFLVWLSGASEFCLLSLSLRLGQGQSVGHKHLIRHELSAWATLEARIPNLTPGATVEATREQSPLRGRFTLPGAPTA